MLQGVPLDVRPLPELSFTTPLKRSDIRADLRITSAFSRNSRHGPPYEDLSDLVTGPESRHDSLNKLGPREPQVPFQDGSSVDVRSARHLNSQDGQDGNTADFTTLNTALVKIELDPPETGGQSINRVKSSKLLPQLDLEIPRVPSYRALRSRKGTNQMKAIEWMTETGKNQFEAHQDSVLDQWGVTAEHAGTCILIPVSWSGLDPQDLVDDLSYEKCPPSETGRLICFGVGYTY